MKPKMILKIFVDLGMTVLLMLLMAFELIGQTAHEWIGAGLFLLFLLHHILNWNWSRSLFRGSCTPVRVLQASLAALVLLTMLGSLVSAVLISREVFAFLLIQGGRALGRSLHMLCAYWGFVFLSLHLGFHWNMILGMARKLVKGDSRIRRAALSLLGACTAAYGAYALFHRNIPSYLFLQTQFVFFDFEEPLVFFSWIIWRLWGCLSGWATFWQRGRGGCSGRRRAGESSPLHSRKAAALPNACMKQQKRLGGWQASQPAAPPGAFQGNPPAPFYFRRIFSIGFPFASSSISLSR